MVVGWIKKGRVLKYVIFFFFLARWAGWGRQSDWPWTVHCVLCMILRSRGGTGAHWENLGKDFRMAYRGLEYFFPASRQRKALAIFRNQAESFHMTCLALDWCDIVIELNWRLWHLVYGRTPTGTLILKRSLRPSASFKTKDYLVAGMGIGAGLHCQSQWREGLWVREIKIGYKSQK